MFLRRVALPAFIITLSVVAAHAVQTQNVPKTIQAPAKPPVKVPAKPEPVPAAAASPTTGWTERVLTVPVAGEATVYVPRQPVNNVVLFVSGDGGWNLGVVDMARRIMPKAIVIGVSYNALRKAPPESCGWFPSGQLELIAQSVEKQLNLPDYHPPVLVGYSSGATMVYLALVASPFSFSGGLSLGFCPDMPSNHNVCGVEGFKPTPHDAKKNEVILPKVETLTREWYVINGIQDEVCKPAAMHAFLDDMGNAHPIIDVPGTGHGFSKPLHWGQPFDESIDKLLAAATALGKPKTSSGPAPAGSLAALEPQFEALGLPLEYVWSNVSKAVVMFVSGDGGWASIDEHLSAYLVQRGVSVVGLNARSYFWNAKDPKQAGADLARLVDVAGKVNVPVFVGGYSMGAEVVPFMLDAWPEANRHLVRGEILVAPSETASFQFSMLNYVFRAKETPHRVVDAVKRIHVPTFCLAGQAESPEDTACDDLGTSAEALRLPGSHHFNSKYDDVGKAVLAFIDKHLTASR